jgi:hypothetical protein
LYWLITSSVLHNLIFICDVLLSQKIGDRKGAVFDGLVEVPLQPITKRKYQVQYLCPADFWMPILHHTNCAGIYSFKGLMNALCSPT